MFLFSLDYANFSVPNEIIDYSTWKIGDRHALKVTVKDAIIGQQFGFGGQDLDVLYLMGRFDDLEVIELKHFPIHVHVLIPKKGTTNKEALENFMNIGWALIYDDITNIPNLI